MSPIRDALELMSSIAKIDAHTHFDDLFILNRVTFIVPFLLSMTSYQNSAIDCDYPVNVTSFSM